MYTITFYSFKGGVGRTMALVNVASELARQGRRVLVVDFDLEAPGLETYRRLRPPNPHPGIVEYITEYRRTGAVPNLLEYLYQAKKIGKKGGRLWVMPAGRRDKAYRTALSQLDWQRLYSEEDGLLLFEDTKAGWEQELNPDYVLIDSRTGDTEVLGICTRQLPDSVVLMFTPNKENLVGLKMVCQSIRREEIEGLKKHIRLHFVAANVPDMDDEVGILRRHLQVFRERLHFNELSGFIRRYENLHLLDQTLFVLTRPHTRLARQYRRLLRTLRKYNPADRVGALAFLKDHAKRIDTRKLAETGLFSCEPPYPPLTSPPQVTVLPPLGYKIRASIRNFPIDSPENTSRGHLLVFAGNPPGGRASVDVAFWRDIHYLHQIKDHFEDDAEVLNEVARCFRLEEGFERSAIQVLDRAIQVQPDLVDARLRRASCKVNLGETESAADDFLACFRLMEPRTTAAPLDSRWWGGQDCLRKFCLFAPGPKLELLGEMLRTREINDVNALITLDYLCRREDGVPIAARFLRDELANGGSVSSSEYMNIKSLLHARCWQEVMQQYEEGKIDKEKPDSIFCLGLAHWGEHREMPKELCKQVLDTLESSKDPGELSRHWGMESFALLLWRLGEQNEALKCLGDTEKQAHSESDDEIFSLWRLHEVPLGQFLDDCRSWRRVIQGEPLRPAFLG